MSTLNDPFQIVHRSNANNNPKNKLYQYETCTQLNLFRKLNKVLLTMRIHTIGQT